MTIEPPKGLKQALLRAYLGFDEEWPLGTMALLVAFIDYCTRRLIHPSIGSISLSTAAKVQQLRQAEGVPQNVPCQQDFFMALWD